MNKSLIVLATAGAFAVPSAAMAVDVSFGGEIDVGVESFDNGRESELRGNNTHSRFWWDVVDDLGTGLQVKGHIEIDWGVNGYHAGNAANDDDSAGIKNRNSYFGLAGESWGEFRFGTQENIHEAIAFSVDPFHGAAGPGGNIVNGMGQSGIASASDVFNGSNIGARRTDSTLTYISPNWSGFTFQIDYALEGPTGTGLETNSNKWTELFYGARYDGQMANGGWRIYAAGADISGGDLSGTGEAATSCRSVGNSCDTDDSGYRIGGGITWSQFAVDFIWETNEWDSSSAGGAKVERDGWNLSASWNIPTGKLAFGYIAMDDRDVNGASVASSATSNLAIGYYHTLSANSSLWIIYNTMDNDANAASNIQSGETAAVGEDPSVISLGTYIVW